MLVYGISHGQELDELPIEEYDKLLMVGHGLPMVGRQLLMMGHELCCGATMRH